MDKILDIIAQNPYRLLGVYSNSPTKERVANEGKLKAFLRVGRQVTFPLDLAQYLPHLSRTTNTPTTAEAKLTLPTDQIRYAQFWFMRVTSQDDDAFKNLFAGDMAKAVDIWGNYIDASSLQNRIVCALIKNDYSTACSLAKILYHRYSKTFVESITGTGSVIPVNLEYDFLDILCLETGTDTILNVVSESNWKQHITSKAVSPIVSRLQAAIDTAKASRGKGASVRYNAGVKLMNNTKNDLASLQKLLSTTDMQYQMMADKIAKEILQCGIDYYNGSEQTSAEADNSMTLQEYALSIAIGQMTKDRCKENVEILKGIIASQPPVEVAEEDKTIKNILNQFKKRQTSISSAISLLNDTRPKLQEIRTKLGATNSYYLKMSTLIVSNALGKVIETVNAVQSSPEIARKIRYGQSLSYTDLENIKSVLRMAWNATKLMDRFDMEYIFKYHNYIPNRNTLQGLCNNFGISTSTPLYDDDIHRKWSEITREWLSSNSQYVAAFILMVFSIGVGILFYNMARPQYDGGVYLCIGIVLGLIVWIYPYIENSYNGGDEALGCLGSFGCYGLVALLPLVIHYWIYKGIAYCTYALLNKESE